ACGPSGGFGRPQYRITADGDHAVDLRFVDGGCRALWIDLESGAWKRLDASGTARAEGRTERRIPPSPLPVALRGYLRQVEASGGHRRRPLALRRDGGGRPGAGPRAPDGRPGEVGVPPFPVRPPLRMIQISNVSPLDGREDAQPPPAPESPDPRPTPEPL